MIQTAKTNMTIKIPATSEKRWLSRKSRSIIPNDMSFITFQRHNQDSGKHLKRRTLKKK